MVQYWFWVWCYNCWYYWFNFLNWISKTAEKLIGCTKWIKITHHSDCKFTLHFCAYTRTPLGILVLIAYWNSELILHVIELVLSLVMYGIFGLFNKSFTELLWPFWSQRIRYRVVFGDIMSLICFVLSYWLWSLFSSWE